MDVIINFPLLVLAPLNNDTNYLSPSDTNINVSLVFTCIGISLILNDLGPGCSGGVLHI